MVWLKNLLPFASRWERTVFNYFWWKCTKLIPRWCKRSMDVQIQNGEWFEFLISQKQHNLIDPEKNEFHVNKLAHQAISLVMLVT